MCRLNNLLRNQISSNRDVGDNCWTFQSLNTRNLLSTDVRYNYPVYCLGSNGFGDNVANGLFTKLSHN